MLPYKLVIYSKRWWFLSSFFRFRNWNQKMLNLFDFIYLTGKEMEIFTFFGIYLHCKFYLRCASKIPYPASKLEINARNFLSTLWQESGAKEFTCCCETITTAAVRCFAAINLSRRALSWGWLGASSAPAITKEGDLQLKENLPESTHASSALL